MCATGGERLVGGAWVGRSRRSLQSDEPPFLPPGGFIFRHPERPRVLCPRAPRIFRLRATAPAAPASRGPISRGAAVGPKAINPRGDRGTGPPAWRSGTTQAAKSVAPFASGPDPSPRRPAASCPKRLIRFKRSWGLRRPLPPFSRRSARRKWPTTAPSCGGSSFYQSCAPSEGAQGWKRAHIPRRIALPSILRPCARPHARATTGPGARRQTPLASAIKLWEVDGYGAEVSPLSRVGALGWPQSCAPRGGRGAQDWGRRNKASRDQWREVQPNRLKAELPLALPPWHGGPMIA